MDNKVYQQLRSYCNRAERCPIEIRVWLGKKGVEEEDCEEYIQRLRGERLLDEERFIRAFASDKLRFSHWGYYKIRQELLSRRLSESMIESIITEVMEEEDAEQELYRLVAKKIELISSDKDQESEIQKMIKYFANKGFPLRDVVATIRTILDDANH